MQLSCWVGKSWVWSELREGGWVGGVVKWWGGKVVRCCGGEFSSWVGASPWLWVVSALACLHHRHDLRFVSHRHLRCYYFFCLLLVHHRGISLCDALLPLPLHTPWCFSFVNTVVVVGLWFFVPTCDNFRFLRCEMEGMYAGKTRGIKLKIKIKISLFAFLSYM